MTIVNHRDWIVILAVLMLAGLSPVVAGDAGDDHYSNAQQFYQLALNQECKDCDNSGCEDDDDCKDCIKVEKKIIIKEDGAFLGVFPVDLNDEKREALDYKGKNGVLVEDVVADGPAAKAGVKTGDIIIKMDDKSIASNDELRAVLTDRKPGDKMELLVVRDGKEKKIKLEIGSRPKEEYTITSPDVWAKEKYAFLGVETEELSKQLCAYFKVDHGVLVETVVEGTPAEASGIKAGDVIYQLGDEEIEEEDDLSEAVRSHQPGEEVDVHIVRAGAQLTIKAKLAEREFPKMGMWSGDDLYERYNFENIDMDEIDRIVKEAMKDVDIYLEAGKEDLKKSMEELKKEMEKMKEEIKKMKDKD